MRTISTITRAARLLAIVMTIGVILPVFQSPLHAAFYKCVDDDGSTTYNDTPCAAEQSTHLLDKSAREVEVMDCRIAQNFTVDAVARMRQEDSVTDVFEAYGGAAKLSVGARDLISYVFSFQNDALITSQRIVNLTIERCQSGKINDSLDKCDTFPKDFITRLGGCVRARHNEQNALIKPIVEDSLSSNKAVDDITRKSEPTLNAARPVRRLRDEPASANVEPVSEPVLKNGPPDDRLR